MFKLIKTDGKARRGELHTAHGIVNTPIFMPVGTQATVKSMTPTQIEEVGAQIILGNTYHLNIRPSSSLIEKLGGLHKFMNWKKPILTDSGGFQAFSLSSLRKISEDGINFKSHLDGKDLFLSPESCMQIQKELGSDICMVLDECIPYPCERDACQKSVERTIRWAKRCLDEHHRLNLDEKNRMTFAIVQGGMYDDIREDCASRLSEMDFHSYAIGGVSVGEPEPEMLKQVAASVKNLPTSKARYVMGVGTPPQLLRMIQLGADMFDCVMPTRLARHGCAFTLRGEINLKNSKYKEDETPIDENILNYTSSFSKAYLRHLIIANEILACTLLSIHNTHFFLELMKQARIHIELGDFLSWSEDWIKKYQSDNSQ